MDAETLQDILKGARLVAVRALSGRTFVLEARRDETKITVTANVVEVLGFEGLPKATLRLRQTKRGHLSQKTNYVTGGQSVFAQRSHWPEDVLRAEGLPLYWSEEWLRAEYERLGSFEAIQKAHGYPANTLSGFALREFGWRNRPTIAPDTKAKAKALRAEGKTLEQIAKALGISKASAMRACK